MTPKLTINGINGATGGYSIPPIPAEQLLGAVTDLNRGEAAQAAYLKRRATQTLAAPRFGIDPLDLAQTGWGVIFEGGDERITAELREALRPLLDHRRAQATKLRDCYYREYRGEDGWRDGEAARAFLQRHKVGWGGAGPDQMPYYLAIVAPPDRISFRCQFQIDVQRAVGRIVFPNLADYADYAERVVRSETVPSPPSRLTFFGPSNRDDGATQLSARELLRPLAGAFAAPPPGWSVDAIIGEDATKARLAYLLKAEERPDILFTASHGMEFPQTDPRQLPHQGALLCQDWPGPVQHRGRIPEDFYMSADDVGTDMRLDGLIAIHFACYSAGTPKYDDFAPLARERAELAAAPFAAALPQRLMNRGALAVIGHVERAWGCSFLGAGTGRQIGTFEDVLKSLMRGDPVGSAMEPMNLRYAELASQLSEVLENRGHGDQVDERELLWLWTESSDARNYAILGDPAARAAGSVKIT